MAEVQFLENCLVAESDKTLICGGESITPLINTQKGLKVSNTLGKNIVSSLKQNVLETKLDYLTINIPFSYISSEYQEYVLSGLYDVLKLKDMPCDTTEKYRRYEQYTTITKSFSKGTNIFINDIKITNEILETEYLTRLELKGTGCREFESRGGDWVELLNYVISMRGYITRLDIANDDFKPYISKSKLDNLIKSRNFTSCFSEFKNDSSRSTKDKSKNKGWGYLFGGINSQTHLRIYDKRLQMIATNQPFDINIKNWLRYELRFSGEKAKSCIYDLKKNINCLGAWASSLLKGAIEFKEVGKDKNKSRLPILDAYNKMLMELEKTKIKVLDEFKHNSSIATSRRWLRTSCAKSIAINELIFEDKDLIREQLELKLIGLLKIKNVDLNAINEDRQCQMLKLLTMEDIREMKRKIDKELMMIQEGYIRKMFKEDVESMFHGNYEYLINSIRD